MKDKLFRFSRLDEFLSFYSPKTPYGRQRKEEKYFHKNQNDLNIAFDRVTMLMEFISSNEDKADKTEYHLSKIPFLSSSVSQGEIRSEIFNIKKFLHHYKNIRAILGESFINEFNLDFNPDPLLSLMDYQKGKEEQFFLSDSYSEDLRLVRKELQRTNDKLSSIKEEQIEEIRKQFALDFRFHDFLVVRESELPEDIGNHINIESYDNTSVILKPRLGQEYFRIHNSSTELLEKERAIEMDILRGIAESIENDRGAINRSIIALRDLDEAMAKSRLSLKFKCIRPRIINKGPLKYKGMRFIPLQEECDNQNVEYTELNADFDAANIVISGSNMGGKTVVLQTILFAQLLTQMGFFIPAESMETHIFSSINLIGGINENRNSGLSSFGGEIMNFITAGKEGKILYIIDEFARTTNTAESYALNSALLKSFSENVGVYSFSSTHLDSLPELKNLSFWSVKGLDYDKYRKYFHSDFKGDLKERTTIINSYMDYRVIKVCEGAASRDALKIADILGLDSEIIEYAKKYMKKQEI